MIYNRGEIDIMGERKDGGVDMFIVSEGPLDLSPETQTLLLDKVENYLNFIQSKEFQKENPRAVGNTRIILTLSEEPPEPYQILFQRISDWCEGEGVRFSTEVKE